VATLNPDHLFEQADKLVVPSPAGPPRQVDLRRAISAAYYGVFHFCLTAAADEFVGVTQRATSRYALVYRSIDHKTFRDLCLEAKKPTPPAKFAPYVPTGGFGPNIQSFPRPRLSYRRRGIWPTTTLSRGSERRTRSWLSAQPALPYTDSNGRAMNNVKPS
jgi:hypothetical protein